MSEDDKLERRSSRDRRDFISDFDTIDSKTDDFLPRKDRRKDRRKMPERRLSNIEVEETGIVEEEFFEYLESYHKRQV